MSGPGAWLPSMHPPGRPPCDAEDGDAFFRRKAEEFAGSLERVDEIVSALLNDLLRDLSIGTPIPGAPDCYVLMLRSVPPIALVYAVEYRGAGCVVRFLVTKTSPPVRTCWRRCWTSCH